MDIPKMLCNNITEIQTWPYTLKYIIVKVNRYVFSNYINPYYLFSLI